MDASSDKEDSFFATRTYRCKDDLVAAVVEYNHLHGRAYRVVTSDKRRYQARCADDQCAFVVRFAFMSAFKPPTLFHAHTCTGLSVSNGLGGVRVRVREPVASPSSGAGRGATMAPGGHSTSGKHSVPTTHTDGMNTTGDTDGNNSNMVITNRACRAKQIARYPEVRTLVASHGATVKTVWLRDMLVGHGLNPTYANCFHARKRLLEDLAADPDRFTQTTETLPPLASFGFGPGSAMVNSQPSSGAGPGASAVMAVASFATKRGAPGTAAAEPVPAKKQRHESPAKQQLPVQTPVSNEPQGCCFICPSVTITSSSKHHQILQWQVRDPTSVKTFFDLYDDSRRIEILKSGTYRLHLYFEAQGSHSDGDEDETKYHLMVNNKPLSVFKDEEEDDDESASEAGQAATRDDVPLGVFNVALVQLKKWDMIVLRRTRGGANSVGGHSEALTPFGRFILELVV